jgi:hypothetical protein
MLEQPLRRRSDHRPLRNSGVGLFRPEQIPEKTRGHAITGIYPKCVNYQTAGKLHRRVRDLKHSATFFLQYMITAVKPTANSYDGSRLFARPAHACVNIGKNLLSQNACNANIAIRPPPRSHC